MELQEHKTWSVANKCLVLYCSRQQGEVQPSSWAHWLVNTRGAHHHQQLGGTDFTASGPCQGLTFLQILWPTKGVRVAWTQPWGHTLGSSHGDHLALPLGSTQLSRNNLHNFFSTLKTPPNQPPYDYYLLKHPCYPYLNPFDSHSEQVLFLCLKSLHLHPHLANPVTAFKFQLKVTKP